jgi:hypothetical protein
MLPTVESVNEIPGDPSLKQVSLSAILHDQTGLVHKVSFSVRVVGAATDSVATISNRAIE